MSKSKVFLNSEEEQEVIDAIRIAEKNTSGEIRVHIEKGSKNDAFDRAKEVFHILEMDSTKLKNGVLIYLDIKNKTFAICGDKGINDVVAPDFWDSTKTIMQSHFKQGQFKQGLIEGILKAGEQLKKHFPWQKDDDNELSDDISKS
jgi:uncharacterized membrane protein